MMQQQQKIMQSAFLTDESKNSADGQKTKEGVLIPPLIAFTSGEAECIVVKYLKNFLMKLKNVFSRFRLSVKSCVNK